MIVGAVIDGWKLKVPNWLTLPMIVSGWAFWALWGWNSFTMSFAGAFVAGALLLIPYAIGGMGAGDVKLYAGFGAWMVPMPWFGFQNLFWAFAISVILGGAMAAVMIWRSGTFFKNLANAQDILQDLRESSSVVEVSAKAKVRKPTLQLLPYGVPLTIGSLCYVALFAASAMSH
jgi:prepilin peptidase CpaA